MSEVDVDAVVAGFAVEDRPRRRLLRFASPPAPCAGVIPAGYSSCAHLLMQSL
jgi:hypothetical protein